MSDELEVGQVWEWVIGEDPYNIQETYLLLCKSSLRQSFSFAALSASCAEQVESLWEALNLETGRVELITPFFTAGVWERLS